MPSLLLLPRYRAVSSLSGAGHPMKKRVAVHSALAVASFISLGVGAFIGPAADQLSIVSAYLCLLLLGLVLLIGPFNAVRKGRPLFNSYLRRDLGIWAAANGLFHFYLANVLSMNYEYLGAYVENAAAPPAAAVRSNLYGGGTISGYIVAVLFMLLLLLSSDWMLRKVGRKWWKRMQRTSYLCFALSAAHAFAFQVLESRPLFWVLVVAALTLLVGVVQGMGVKAVINGGKKTSVAVD